MGQILVRQRLGALDSVVLIEDAGMLVAQERAGGPLRADAVQRIGHADHWYIDSPMCVSHVMKPSGCHMDLCFSQGRLLRIIFVSYFGPTDL
jgi:hypothetical protein